MFRVNEEDLCLGRKRSGLLVALVTEFQVNDVPMATMLSSRYGYFPRYRELRSILDVR